MKIRQQHLLWPVVLVSNLNQIVSAIDIGIAASTANATFNATASRSGTGTAILTNDGQFHDGSFIQTSMNVDNDNVHPITGDQHMNLPHEVTDLGDDEGPLKLMMNHFDEVASNTPSHRIVGTSDLRARALREGDVEKVKEVEEDEFELGPGNNLVGVFTTTAEMDNFLPLDCNSQLDDAPCTNLSDELPSNDKTPLTIPCGKCYKYDLGAGDFTFAGIRVIGKLLFPDSTSKAVISTPYVIVEGQLTIFAKTDVIGPENESVTFKLTGTEEVQFKPSDSPNLNSCPKSNNYNCKVGKKPFVVVGGKLDIQAFDEDQCFTHTPILDKGYTDITPNATLFEAYEPFLPTCRTNYSESDFFRFDFNDGSYGNWTGNYGAYVHVEDNALKVTNRIRKTNGPQLDYSSLEPASCLIPGKRYLVSARIKLYRADGTLDGLPSSCKNSTGSCPRMRSYMRSKEDNAYDQDISQMRNYKAPNYGEWWDWYSSIIWNENELNPTNAFALFRMSELDTDVDISVDQVRIHLPTRGAYADPNDLCGELILNGDAEADHIHPYPILEDDYRDRVFVRQENGNNYFHLPNRKSSSTSIRAIINTECMQQGVTYFASHKVRIHSEFEEEYYFYFRFQKQDSSWQSYTYLSCPPQTYFDGWVTCSGEFTVPKAIVNAKSVKALFHFSNARDISVTVDFDDISIKYHRGPIKELIVDADDAQCWGPGAELHIASSTYYSYEDKVHINRVSNGFNTLIDYVNDNNDGTLSIGLSDSPYIPVTTVAEREEFSTDVALISRNVKIESDRDESNKGAHLQIIKTPNVTQTISGVEFAYMGRLGAQDRFPLTLLYSGSIEGTKISSNSIHNSFMRCISIEGTSNVTISRNVAYRNIGICIRVGDEAEDNFIEHNLVSDLRPIWNRNDMIPLDDDRYATGFRNRYGNNHYFFNKAISCRYAGFSFNNQDKTFYENHGSGAPNPRKMPMGEFAFNEARGNGDSGMRFHYHQQAGSIVFRGLKIIMNRNQGFYLYDGSRAALESSLLAENGRNIHFYLSDNVNVTDADIRGISPSTKYLVHPPYFNKPCTSSGFYSPIGYLSSTYLNRFQDPHRGAKLENVSFSLFDQSDRCSPSIPIAFRSDKRDGHWDYMSSFTNVTVNGTKFIDAKEADENGITDIIISDPDGRSNPAFLGKENDFMKTRELDSSLFDAGSFVSNKPYLTNLARGKCELYHDGISYCEGACYRTVRLMVGQTGTAGYDLKVTREDDGAVTYIPSIYEYDGYSNHNYNMSLHEGYPRRYSASLPFGKYQLEFFENDKPVWPQYVFERWEGVPDCEGYASLSNVTIVERELVNRECDDLIVNGNMDDGVDGWLHRDANSGPKGEGYLLALPEAGIGGSTAIGYFDRGHQYHGIGQNLDTRCLHQNINTNYEVKAGFRLERNGVPFICDRFTGNYPNRCPKATIKYAQYEDPEKKQEMYWNTFQNVAMVLMPNSLSDFNLMHGVMKVGEIYESLHRIFIYFEQVDKRYDIILDDVSITKMEPICSGEFLRNGDFSTGDSRFWGAYGTSKWDIVNDIPGISTGDHALKVYDRGSSDHGSRQEFYMDVDCLSDRDRIQVVARYQLQDSEGNPIRCDILVDGTREECAWLRVKSYSDDHGEPHDYIGQTAAVHSDIENGDWTIMTGIFTLGHSQANHTRMYTHVGGAHKEVSIVLDYVSFQPLPKTCHQMIVNPNFKSGTTEMWRRSDRRADFFIHSPGRTDDYALSRRTITGKSSYGIIYQSLDTRCLVEGQEYQIQAYFKLLNATDTSETLECDPNERNVRDKDVCPFIRLRGYECEEDFHLYLWNEAQAAWNPDNYNLYRKTVPVDKNIASCRRVNIELGHWEKAQRIWLVDDVTLEQRTTPAPTPLPTLSPTKAVTIGPTPEPTIVTEAPTTSLAISCPPVGEFVTLDAGSIIVDIAEADTLCTLTKLVPKTLAGGGTTQTFLPLARSYDLNTWELSTGSFALYVFPTKEFLCYDRGCQINLPLPEAGEQYRLTSTKYKLGLRDEYARFLETASFGPIAKELDKLESATGENGSQGAIVDYIEEQMDSDITSMSSHREFWRSRSSPRAPWSTPVGTSYHPCDEMSRWRKFTFERNDAEMSNRIRVVGDGPYTLLMNDHVKTVVDDFWLKKNDAYFFDPDFEYEICSLEQKVNGEMRIELQDGRCVTAENPPIDLSGQENELIYELDLSSVEDLLVPFESGEQFTLPVALDDDLCDSIPEAFVRGDAPVFGRLSDGTWLHFDPRLSIKLNTPDSPLPDGGKSSQVVTGGVTRCSNVPRTFLNEDQCTLSSDACKLTAPTQIEVVLDDESITKLFNLTDRYIYAMKGLNVVDQNDDEGEFAWKLPHPCTDSMRSRWLRKNFTDCNPTEIFSGTHESLVKLLSDNSDNNPYVKDIFFSSKKFYCNETDTNPDIEISFGSQCWKRVHDDYSSVFDLTYWVDRHPGGPYHIMKWAENGTAFLEFPNSHPVNGHPMYRWHLNVHKFTFLGRYGDTIRIQDLPSNLRTQEVNDFYEDSANIDTSGVLACGSFGEVPNNRSLGYVFDMQNNGFITNFWSKEEAKKNVWFMINLDAPDQLRQRVAWALAQILVIVPTEIGSGSDNTEWFLHYYDIFVRNAFGNYRNVLKEISYSPMMAENLSFMNSKSSAYVWQRYQVKAEADENFAREIMQLFSMGLVLLNIDGSPKLDANNDTILAYTNDDIMSLSRSWTGFYRQPSRANIEGAPGGNKVDPMRLDASWRDRFPKHDTSGGYIGDYYPLCEDLPEKAFLKQGATYRLLGSSSMPELMTDPHEFKKDESIQRVVLDLSSPLRDELCNPNDSNECQFLNTVVLSDSKECTGIECEVDTLRVVQVANNMFYEYVREPCVNNVFYNGAKKLSKYRREWRVMCGNPNLVEAAEACCSFGSLTASRNSNYDGERMSFATAMNRCNAVSKNICDFYRVEGPSHKISYNFFWTSDDCQIRVKIGNDGMVTIVHEPFDSTHIELHVGIENENWFKVYWEGDKYPTALNGCDGICSVVNGDSCLCGTSVSKTVGFRKPPSSVDEILKKLHIGSLNPKIIDSDAYSSTYDPETGVTTHLKDEIFDSSTVFEFSDDKGRTFFVKNSAENVQVRSLKNGYSGYSFRNAPQFMSSVRYEETIRDAQFETEATLDHYFYHDNTAPFIATRMIQRLVLSNPSPRYIKTVATAFKSGIYESMGKSFGTGNYGDLAATFAAIYLDREARIVLLDDDPSTGMIREPLIKVMSLLRSMKYVPNKQLIRMNVGTKIGQNSHSFGSVFSFFLPEFQPYGRIGDTDLVSPESTLVDMPRIVGLLNGLLSLAKYGLSSCEGGFGRDRCNEKAYSLSPNGFLEYNRTSLDTEFSFETFEGPSLVGGLDNTWVGRNFYKFWGKISVDPQNTSNHVFHPSYDSRHARIYSQPVIWSKNDMVVKFQYFGTRKEAGGCIGYHNLNASGQKWVFCDGPSNHAKNKMVSDGKWISCQFEVPLNKFRIALGDRRFAGDSYFDNIQIGRGKGTFCGSQVVIEDKIPPGRTGHSDAVVDDLATLLTAGRLNAEKRSIIREEYDKAGSENDGLRIAQQMILTSAEFHSTNPVKSRDESRGSEAFPPPTGKPYKAVVYVLLSGGCDSWNMLVPHTCPRENDVYETYLDIRKQVAISKTDLLPIDASNQICSKYGVHPKLEAVKRLYDDGDLLFFANAGGMSRPVNKNNWSGLTNIGLFAHNLMQREAQRVDPYNDSAGTGVIGRMADVLNGFGHNAQGFSVGRYSVALVGSPTGVGPPMIVNSGGVPKIDIGDKIKNAIKHLHNKTSPDSGFFAETWSDEMNRAFNANDLLRERMQNIKTNITFPGSSLGSSLSTVARLMALREERGADTDIFFIEMGGFDTHSNVEEALNARFTTINNAIEAFEQEMKLAGLWNNVTIVQTSDFARTLNPNSGDGTDHAWGGNYMMMGGAVVGGQIAGDYSDFNWDLRIGRGRMIPTTPWDAIFRTVAAWVGVPEFAMEKVVPNIGNFGPSNLIDPNDVFDGVPPPPPTDSPTSAAPTLTPSTEPSLITENPTTATPTTGAPTSSPSSEPSRITNAPSNVPSRIPSSSPTEYPTFAPICSDEPGYLQNGAATKNCAYVARKKKCAVKDQVTGQYTFEHCRQSCDRCACENEDFYYQNNPKKDCNWVSKRQKSRCNLIPTIRDQHCKGACDEGCCADDPNFAHNNQQFKNCSWIKKRKDRRCAIGSAAYQCPVACGLCG